MHVRRYIIGHFINSITLSELLLERIQAESTAMLPATTNKANTATTFVILHNKFGAIHKIRISKAFVLCS